MATKNITIPRHRVTPSRVERPTWRRGKTIQISKELQVLAIPEEPVVIEKPISKAPEALLSNTPEIEEAAVEDEELLDSEEDTESSEEESLIEGEENPRDTARSARKRNKRKRSSPPPDQLPNGIIYLDTPIEETPEHKADNTPAVSDDTV